MTHLTLNSYILSLKFPLLYENETSSRGPKNCQKIGVYDKKKHEIAEKDGLKIIILNQQFRHFAKTFAQMHNKSAMQTAGKLVKNFQRPNFLYMFKQNIFAIVCII